MSPPPAPLLLYACLFAGVLLTVLGLARLLAMTGEPGEQAINRRLRMLASGADPKEVLRMLRRQQDPEGFERVPLVRDWPALVTQSGLRLRPGPAFVLMLIAVLVLFLVLSSQLRWPAALLLALTAGGGLPVLLLRIRRGRRRAELARQLPDAIDLMVQSLRAGHPLNPAFQVIAREMPDPIGTELGIVADAITYGDELTTAVDALANRIGLEDFNYLAVAITIQHSTGGNLAGVLEALSHVIRDRFAMDRKIRALSAEGRITALVVSGVPFFLGGFLHLTTPSYYGDVVGDPLLLPLLAVGGLLALANALVLRRLVRFHF